MDLSTGPRVTPEPARSEDSSPPPANGSSPTAGETTPPADASPPAPKQSPSSPSAQPAALPPKAAATGAIPRELHLLMQPDDGPNDVIFVTGFGPFGTHVVNASWEAVCRLHEVGVAEELGVQLVIEEVPVTYEYVMREIPKRWRELRPRLVVHVGVSAHTMTLQLERVSHNGPYQRDDVHQRTPPEHCCVPGRPSTLCTRLDLARTCKAIGNSRSAIDASVSDDAGHYLCDFIYFTSLSQDPGRAVFVHVPPLGMPYTANQMADGLAEAIRDLYGQVLEMDRPAVRALDLSCPGQRRV
ncbi:pyroglutamyl-peptidase 1-like [Pollicipes pollicipes]|uniref:pyroglutamyl-peptidase 1-like n=1 Tax=Pollicipes pollicipes TaxID=41117 RepID=UPI00188494C8|nr:pyroglutamyl-peptidase 1-like [Pollicipes pollicipes]